MINVATMKTNNVGLILGAFALNGLAGLVSVIAWLLAGVLNGVAAVIMGAVALVVNHWRALAMVAGLVLAVGLVLIFWQAILVGASVLGGMYAGLLGVMRI